MSILNDESRMQEAAHAIFGTSLRQMNVADGERSSASLTGQFNSGYIDADELQSKLEHKSTYELLGMAEYLNG